MRRVKSVFLVALLIGTICVSGCSGAGSSNSVSIISSSDTSAAESSAESEEESSQVSEESVEFTDETAIENVKAAILEHLPDANFGEIEILRSLADCKGTYSIIGVKGTATVTDSYGRKSSKKFGYSVCAWPNGNLTWTNTGTGKYIGRE